MISHIFANMHITLQTLAKHSKTPQERGFRLAAEVTNRLIANKIKYAFMIKDNVVYFEGYGIDGKIFDVVALDLDTGKYTNVDLKEYLRRYV